MADFKVTVKDVVERRNDSREYMRTNYWDEFQDAYRAYKCKTEKIMVVNEKNEEVEDTSRTNIALPEIWKIGRTKTARQTANPPTINYRAVNDQSQLAERLTAARFQQFDKSGEARQFYKLVHQANIFGIGIGKRYWNKMEVTRQFRYNLLTIAREKLMQLQGAGPDEIAGAVQKLGSQLSQDEVAQAMQQAGGTEITVPTPTIQYEGPCLKAPFIGDIHFEPGICEFNESSYFIEEYTEGLLWLQKMKLLTYKDPETRQEVPVCDQKVLKDISRSDDITKSIGDQKTDTLKHFLRDAVNVGQPTNLSRQNSKKKIDVLECHEQDDYGQWWVSWVVNEKHKLGCMPYPYDLNGRSSYTAFVPMPDFVSPIGDSSPRSLRFLHAVRNANVGQIIDLVSNTLRPTYKIRISEDISDEQMSDRKFGKVLRMRDPNAISLMNEPVVPPGAWETNALMLREEALAEGTLNTVDTGSESNPLAGKLATTAILNAKNADALTQDELKWLNVYLKEDGEKSLAMQAQMMQEAMQVDQKYVRTEAMQGAGGDTSMVTIEWEELQQEIEVEPEAGSMLSVDDAMKTTAAQNFAQIAFANPDVYSKRYAAGMYAKTIPGVDITEALIPEGTPPAMPPPKVGVNVSFKGELLPADAQVDILGAAGVNISEQAKGELGQQDQLKAVTEMSQAADSAENLSKPADTRHPADVQQQKDDNKIDKMKKKMP